MTLPTLGVWTSNVTHWFHHICLAQEHYDGQAAGDRDNKQGQQMAQEHDQVFIHTVEGGTVILAALKEIEGASAAVLRRVFHGSSKGNGKRRETEKGGERHTNAI